MSSTPPLMSSQRAPPATTSGFSPSDLVLDLRRFDQPVQRLALEQRLPRAPARARPSGSALGPAPPAADPPAPCARSPRRPPRRSPRASPAAPPRRAGSRAAASAPPRDDTAPRAPAASRLGRRAPRSLPRSPVQHPLHQPLRQLDRVSPDELVGDRGLQLALACGRAPRLRGSAGCGTAAPRANRAETPPGRGYRPDRAASSPGFS